MVISLTVEDVKKMIPTNSEPELWHSFCIEFFPLYDITTPNRIAGFFAQCGHESSDFKLLFENLNYSWQRLRQVFPKYFTSDSMAKQYERNPQKIANYVYADVNRSSSSKLGNVYPNDGYTFRGRGIIQLTGRTNYTAFGLSIGKTPEEAAVYCGTKRGAFEAGCWYWKQRNLNKFCDNDDITGMTKAINGGTIGIADRIARYNRNKIIVKNSGTTSSFTFRMLSKGDRGEDVKEVQKYFKLSADGIFGPLTEKAIRSWQRTKNYTVTGKLTIDQVKMIYKLNGKNVV